MIDLRAVAAAGCLTVMLLTAAGCDAEDAGGPLDRAEALDGVADLSVDPPTSDDKVGDEIVTATMKDGATEADYVAALEHLQDHAEASQPSLVDARVAHPDSTSEDFVGVRILAGPGLEASPDQLVGWFLAAIEALPAGRATVFNESLSVRVPSVADVGPAITVLATNPAFADVTSGIIVGLDIDRFHFHSYGSLHPFEEEGSAVWADVVDAMTPLGLESTRLTLTQGSTGSDLRWVLMACADVPPGGVPDVDEDTRGLTTAVGGLVEAFAYHDARLLLSTCGRQSDGILEIDKTGTKATVKGAPDWSAWAAERLAAFDVEVKVKAGR